MQPTLTTDRLLLRPFEPSDAASVQRLLCEREIALNTAMIPHPYPDGAAAEWIARQPDWFATGFNAVFAIVEQASHQVIGCVGLTFESAHNRADMGYWIGKPFWGRGFVTEAARSTVQYGFGTRHLARICADHFARNVASGRVLQKLGFRREGVLRQHFVKWGEPQDVVRYGMLREEWLSSTPA